MSNVDLNPRYVAYCNAHGLTPDEMMERDSKLWTGGIMAGFILWNSAALAECCKEHPDYFLDGHLVDHVGYDDWLRSWAVYR